MVFCRCIGVFLSWGRNHARIKWTIVPFFFGKGASVQCLECMASAIVQKLLRAIVPYLLMRGKITIHMGLLNHNWYRLALSWWFFLFFSSNLKLFALRKVFLWGYFYIIAPLRPLKRPVKRLQLGRLPVHLIVRSKRRLSTSGKRWPCCSILVKNIFINIFSHL